MESNYQSTQVRIVQILRSTILRPTIGEYVGGVGRVQDLQNAARTRFFKQPISNCLGYAYHLVDQTVFYGPGFKRNGREGDRRRLAHAVAGYSAEFNIAVPLEQLKRDNA